MQGPANETAAGQLVLDTRMHLLPAQASCRDAGTRFELRSHRRSSNANSLCGRNSAGSLEICATFQRDILAQVSTGNPPSRLSVGLLSSRIRLVSSHFACCKRFASSRSFPTIAVRRRWTALARSRYLIRDLTMFGSLPTRRRGSSLSPAHLLFFSQESRNRFGDACGGGQASSGR
jgi:hypothetical protein